MPIARAASIVVAKAQYVPGATPVFVAGKVQEFSASWGKILVGELEIGNFDTIAGSCIRHWSRKFRRNIRNTATAQRLAN